MKKITNVLFLFVLIVFLAFQAHSNSLISNFVPRIKAKGPPVISPDSWPDAVALISGNGFCSGILISPTAVATAAHCLCHGGTDVVISMVVFGTTIKSPVDSIPVDHQETYNGTCHGFPNSVPLPNNLQDIAYVHLQHATKVKPRKIASSLQISITQSLTSIGYGQDDNPSGTFGQKRSALGIPVVSHDCVENHSSIPLDCHAHWEMFAKRVDSGICIGDSGGPAYSESNNHEVFPVAIASRFDGGACANNGAEYVRLDGMAGAWLRKKVTDMPPESN